MKLTEYHPFKSAKAKEDYLNLYDKLAGKWPVPSETQMINTNYGKTFVRISGPIDAPPLVLLTGLGGNSLDWIPQIRELSEQFRTYAVDNINDIGQSVYTKPPKCHEDFTAWLDDLFTALDLKNNINLMGMSYGGWLAGEYALCHSEKINKIVLLEPGAIVLPVSPEFLAKMGEIMQNSESTENVVLWLYKDAIEKDEANLEKIKTIMEERLIETSFFEPKQVIPPRVFEDNELNNIKVPALFIIGENETMYSAQEAAKRLNRVAPQIKTEIIPKAGHDLMHAQQDLVIKKVLEFLSE